MENHSGRASCEDVFSQLDECVDRALAAEQSGDWTPAEKAAEKLRYIVCGVRMAYGISHATAILVGLVRKDWLLAVVSTITVASIIADLYSQARK